jgi:hypothetical protein
VEPEKDGKWLDEDIPTPLDTVFDDDGKGKKQGKSPWGIFGWH